MVRAQDVPPGIQAKFDITQRLEFSDNPGLNEVGQSDFFGRTVLGFGLESVTRVERLGLNLGLDIEEGRRNQSSVDTNNPFIRFGYDRNTRNATIGGDFIYREADVESDIDDFEFDLDGNVISQNSGTRESVTLGFNGAVGRDAPIGARWNWRYNEISYSGSADSDLTDQSSNTFSGQLNFRLSPRITARLGGNYRDFDAQGNGVNRETTGLSTGVDLTISRVWSADLGIGYSRIERSGEQSNTNEGIDLRASARREVSNGSWALRFSTDVESNDSGRRSLLLLERAMDLPRGSLSYSLGVTGADLIGTDPLVNVNYTGFLPTAQLRLGLSQRVVTDNNNNERINTTLRASFDQRVNNSSSIGVSASLFAVNNLTTESSNRKRLNLSLNYRYDLTRDWGLVGGFSHTLQADDNRSDRRRNTVFLGLQRSFNWTP